MRTVVTGARGLLGPFLVEELSKFGDVVAVTRDVCDLRDGDAVTRMLGSIRPDVVVHAAAFTDVDGCERDPERARFDNLVATENLARADRNAHLIVISTDQVYPGTPGLHREATTGPVNVYGRTKLAAERAASEHPRHLVLRTNFFAASRTPGRKSLSDVIVERLAEGRSFPGFVDSFFSPLHATTVASHVSACIEDGLVGTYNLGSRQGCSKAEFARMVARHLGLDDRLVKDAISSVIPGRAPRPHDLRMDVDAYACVVSRKVPVLEEEVVRL